MIFRFAITWTLIVALVGAYQPAIGYNEEAITLGNLIPYEKFVDGDAVEPLLYAQYQLTENVSPYVPLSFLAGLNPAAYQTPANSYELAKPMPANFNVYTAKNPAPVQYKPAPPVYGQPPANAYPSGPPVSYAPSPPPVGYAPPPLPPANLYPPPPAVNYGVNYEHNKLPLYLPGVGYPASPQSYLVQPPAAYPPIPSYMPAIPTIVEPVKPEASKAKEIEKVEEKIEAAAAAAAAAADPPPPVEAIKPAVSAILNEAPAIKPDKNVLIKPAKPVLPVPADKIPPVPAVEPAKPVPPVPLPVPLPIPIPKYKSQRSDSRVTGYRYVAQSNRRRSAPTTNGQATSARNQQQYRSAPAYPPYQTAAYPPSVSYSDANQTASYYKRAATSYANQYKATAKDAKRGAAYAPAYGAASPAYAPASPGYAPATPAYGAASSKSYYPAAGAYQPQAYNENNVAEAVLRGFSVNPEENNNKAIVRIFEEANYAIYFDIRVCDLKKDHLYSIYIHDYGQLTAGCESAGGQFGAKDTYFNPILGLRTNPSGFIGSFKYNGENLNIQHYSKRLLLASIIGRSIVIHEVQTNQKVLPEAIENNMLNTFTMLMNPLSSPLVTSKRVACGVIGRANPYSFLRPPNQSCEIEVPVVEEKPVVDAVGKRDVKDPLELDPKKEIKIDGQPGLP